MNHHVPDFGIEEDDDPVAFAFGFPTRKTAADSLAGDDELAEILWQKGPVLRRFPPPDDLPNRADFATGSATDTASSAAAGEGPAELFMGEDEMASWLHCFRDNAVAAGAADSGAQCAPFEQQRPAAPLLPTGTASRSSLPPLPRMASASRASTVVESNMTPEIKLPSLPSIVTAAATTFELSEAPRASEKGSASSSAGSRDHAGGGQDRKRKAHESDDSDGEDADSESDEKKKEIRKPVKKSRAAEVHNLSERRRRDRINEKMKALQQLIPRCNKSDKASMLDDAVEYLKSLQLQIQMMSMGCAMTPAMFPGVQQYMRPMGMPIGMGVDTSRGSMAGRTILPFPPVVQGSPVPASAAAHLGGRVPIQGFHPPTVAVNGQINTQVAGQQDPATNFVCLQGPNPVQVLNVPNPYQQYFTAYQMQLPEQTQPAMEPPAGKSGSMPE